MVKHVFGHAQAVCKRPGPDARSEAEVGTALLMEHDLRKQGTEKRYPARVLLGKDTSGPTARDEPALRKAQNNRTLEKEGTIIMERIKLILTRVSTSSSSSSSSSTTRGEVSKQRTV
ncbi:hypothetical protein E4U43_004449 [Claviceps pusilla]|uniref:Uncharacterized protein n=1 Tax=Claviceps pusilla TaxID=123648 RepID=A0A9P7N5W6_9HYPO|nr:hypothetical protein E4U43_004449 [Claviceps pusilla]